MIEEAIPLESVTIQATDVICPDLGSDGKEKTISKTDQDHRSNVAAEDSIVYPRGAHFALISGTLCFCVFLVGLVSVLYRAVLYVF